MKKDLIRKGRSISDLKVHLLLSTKANRKIFTVEMLDRLHEVFLELLDKRDCKLIDFNGEEFYVHLLFQYYPDTALSDIINNLKSVSSRKLRQEFKKHIDLFYDENVLWSDHYLIVSCGGATLSSLRELMEARNNIDR